MSRKRNKRIWGIAAAGIILLLCYIYRLSEVRRTFSVYGEIQNFQEGEVFEERGLSLSVFLSESLSLDEYEGRYGILSQDSKALMQKERARFVIIQLHAFNNGREVAVCPFLETFFLQGLTWSMNYSREWTENAGFMDREIVLEPGEGRDYTLVYALYGSLFQDQWERFLGQNLYLSIWGERDKKSVAIHLF